MGRAGKALRQVLAAYKISQYQLATRMGIDRSNLSRWVGEQRDPAAEAVFEIRLALEIINPAAARDFVNLYFYDRGDEENIS